MGNNKIPDIVECLNQPAKEQVPYHRGLTPLTLAFTVHALSTHFTALIKPRLLFSFAGYGS